jgi:succinate dehydrogenase flavin-adding protein (antitoxin of CptAB toxin-antitoxin module)
LAILEKAGGCTDFLVKPFAAANLSLLPYKALVILHRLAIEGDDFELAKWLKSRSDLPPTAKEALANLIKNYRFEIIQQITALLVSRNAKA